MDVFNLAATLLLDSSAYKKGLEDAKGMSNSFMSGLTQGFKSIASVGAKAFKAVGDATLNFTKSALQAGMSFDASMSQVAATMGKTMAEMESEVGSVTVTLNGQVKEFNGTLRDFAQFMGANTAFSATQAADALNYMALAGYNTQQSMEMLPNVLSLAAAGGFDLARASDMITDASTAFGLSVTENGPRINQMVDEMAKAASTGNTSVEQLGDAFLKVGGLAQELNGGFVTLANGSKATTDGIQELEIALTAMANAGVKGSEAGTHMRNMLLKLSSPTKDGVMALQKLGVTVFDTTGNMRSLKDIFGDLNKSMETLTQEDKIGIISDLFNARDIASAEALLNAVSQDWDKIGESILNAEGAASQMAATQLDNLTGDVTLFKSALESVQITLSDALTPTLRDFVQFGTDGLTRITEAAKSGGFQGVIDIVGNLINEGLEKIGSYTPKLLDAGKTILTSIIQGMADNSDIIIQNFLALAGDILPALFDLGADFINTLSFSFAENSMAFEDTVVGVLNNVLTNLKLILPNLLVVASSIIGIIIETITRELPNLVKTGAKIIESIAKSIKNEIPRLWEAGVEVVKGIGMYITENLGDIGLAAIALLHTIVENIASNFPILFDTILSLIEFFANSLVEVLPELIPAVFQIIYTIAETLTNPDSLMRLVDVAINLILALANGLIDALPIMLEKAPIILQNLVEAIIKALPKLAEAAIQIVFTLGEGIITNLDKFVLYGVDMINALITGIVGLFTDLGIIGIQIFDAIGDAFLSVIHNAWTWGGDIIDNIIGGLKSKWQDLVNSLISIGDLIADYLGFSEPEKGPLSNFHTYAPDMMDLFMEGIENSKNALSATLNDTLSVLPTTTIQKTMQQTPALAAGGGGDFIFPIYLGDELIDTAVVSALDRVNYKSSGRA